MAGQSHLKLALKQEVPSSVEAEIQVGDLGLMYSEKTVRNWVGLYHVTGSKRIQLTLNTEDRFLSGLIENISLYVKRNVKNLEADPSDVNLSSDKKAGRNVCSCRA